MSRYDGCEPISWRGTIGVLLALFAFFAFMGIANAQEADEQVVFIPAVEDPVSVLYEISPNVWATNPAVAEYVVKPPTEKQLACIGRWRGRDIGANVLDVATTSVGLALGFKEAGLASIAGSSAFVVIPVVIGIKVIGYIIKRRVTKALYNQQRYDEICDLWQTSAILSVIPPVANAVTIAK